MRNNPIRTKWEVVDGRRVRLWTIYPRTGAWRDAATHPPLLLIHGLGCSVEAWGPALRRLADCHLDRPVYAADMPGSGRSHGPRKAMGIAALADWTARLMDVLGIPRSHLAGNSAGCQVALALARRHPHRAGGLVLVGPTDGGDMVPVWRYVVGLLLDAFFEPMLYNGTLVRMYLQMGVPRYFATARKMMRDDPINHAGDVQAPVLIVRGARDMLVPDHVARKLSAELPEGAFILVEDSAHAVQFNAPEAFARIALAFWERAEARMGLHDASRPAVYGRSPADLSAAADEPVAGLRVYTGGSTNSQGDFP